MSLCIVVCVHRWEFALLEFVGAQSSLGVGVLLVVSECIVGLRRGLRVEGVRFEASIFVDL